MPAAARKPSGASRSSRGPIGPALLGRFLVEEELGRGGQGRVVAALDQRTGERVALKLLDEVAPDALGRLKGEFHALARFHHAHLARVRELFVGPEAQLFSMELVRGETIDVWWAARRGAVGAGGSGGSRDLRPLLRKVLQLVDALEHLHAAGFVHRDVKAANVLVEQDTRAVLLDLGDATRMGALAVEPRSDVAGSVATMAPEVAWRGGVSAATDAYSLGALVYELIERRPCFAGSPSEVLVAKARRAPARAQLAPEALADLLERLLQPAPADRASLGELRRLAARLTTGDDSTGAATMRAGSPAPTVARQGELAELEQAATSAFANRWPGMLCIEGEAGIGKTTLAERLVVGLRRERGATILASRCSPSLRVELPGLDGIVDGLARDGIGAELDVPAATEACLRRTFPALGSLLRGGLDVPPFANPAEERATALRAMGHWLESLARATPLALLIDDLQWCDLESLAVFEDLLTRRAPVLIVATSRSGRDAGHAARLLRAADTTSSVHERVLLGRCGPVESIEIVRAAAIGPLSDLACAELAERSGGHPLFAWVLARAPDPGSATLPALLASRRQGLKEAERALLDAICLARDRLPLRWLAEAAGCSEAIATARRLIDDGWAQEIELQELALLVPYHDLVRTSVAESLTEGARSALELRLARAFERSGLDAPLAIAKHLLAAGAAEQAATVARRAAARAEKRGAYELAAELLGVVLETPLDDLGRAALLEQRARIFATCGHPGRAAEDYLAAAELVRASGSGEARAAELSGRASAWLMRAARIVEGSAELRRHLASAGIAPARDGLAALIEAIKLRRSAPRWAEELLARADHAEGRGPSDAATKRRSEALWSAVHGLAHANPIHTLQYGFALMAESARGGDRAMVARSLSIWATALATDGAAPQQARAHELAAAGRAAARKSSDADEGFAIMASATTRFYLGEWAEGLQEVDECHELLRRGRQASDITIGDCHGMGAVLCWLGGDLASLAARRLASMAHARHAGDGLVLAYAQGGWAILAPLARGEGASALRDLDLGLTPYATAQAGLPHTYAALARALAALHAARPMDALRLLTAELTHPSRFGLVGIVRTHRVLFAFALINALLRVAEVGAGPLAGLARTGADALAHRLGREDSPWCRPLADIARGAVEQSRGRDEAAASAFERARAACGALPLPMIRDALDHRLHALGRGARPVDWPRWVVEPSRWVDTVLPGRSTPR